MINVETKPAMTMTTTATSLPPPGQVVISDPNIQLPLPELKYGYRDEPLTWSELTKFIIHHRPPDLARLTRSSQNQTTYQIFNYHMKQQYVSSTDYLLISKFGFDAVPVPAPVPAAVGDSEDEQGNKVDVGSTDRRRWRAQPSLEETTETQSMLIENDFPYHFADDIKHYILWKLKGNGISEQEIQESKQQLQTKFKTTSTLHWTNPPNLQSIPAIDHVHILCRLPKASS